MKIYIVSMIRNEIDIIADFLSFYLNIADRLIIADMQSSDGTREIIDEVSSETQRVECVNFPYSGMYQAETLTALSKRAFDDGADWVFFIDADEFLRIDDRLALESYLKSFGSQVMHLPWINLVPSSYGAFGAFDLSQDFFWSGRTSHFKKVAISAHYALRHPDFLLEAGSHNVKPHRAAPSEAEQLGLPLMHVPVRSAERTKHKAFNALGTQKHKHNRAIGEGVHHKANVDFLAGRKIEDILLNGIAQDYGSREPIRACNPAELGWPKLRIELPKQRRARRDGPAMEDLLRADEQKSWLKLAQPSGVDVSAQIINGQITLFPQSIRGTGMSGPQMFLTLSDECNSMVDAISTDALARAAEASLLDPPILVPSAWTDLVPVLGALLSIIKPRRFVELGTHNGMSFFSACNFSKVLNLDIECVAVDSWIGDQHASFHSAEIFEDFSANIRTLFPEQLYLRSYFDDAAQVFEQGSIDLLHIDGLHTYESVKHDFETWISKMSKRSVIIFHDTNVHERGFGVWRLWQEVTSRYPGMEVYHGHGLGILYTGEMDSDVAKPFALLAKNPELKAFITRYFEALNKKKLAHSNKAPKTESFDISAMLAMRTADLNTIVRDKWWKRTRHLRRWSNSIRKMQGKPKKIWPGPVE